MFIFRKQQSTPLKTLYERRSFEVLRPKVLSFAL